MNFVNGQEYTGKNGVVGTWNSQTGCFHVVDGEVSTKFTAAEFLDEPVEVKVSTPITEE